MPVIIRRKEGENPSSFLFRASKRIQKSGVLRQTRRARFHKTLLSRNKKWSSAMHRVKMEGQIGKFLKLGYPLSEAVVLARKINRGIIKK